MIKDEIYRILLDLLDLQVLEDRSIYYPMSNTVFILEGKYLKLYTDNEIKSGLRLDNTSELLFDPINSYKLAEKIFQFFLCSLRDNEDVIIDNVVKLPKDNLGRTVLYIMYQEDYSKLYSDGFNNTCLCFIDIIFKYNNINIDLHQFDRM